MASPFDTGTCSSRKQGPVRKISPAFFLLLLRGVEQPQIPVSQTHVGQKPACQTFFLPFLFPPPPFFLSLSLLRNGGLPGTASGIFTVFKNAPQTAVAYAQSRCRLAFVSKVESKFFQNSLPAEIGCLPIEVMIIHVSRLRT